MKTITSQVIKFRIAPLDFSLLLITDFLVRLGIVPVHEIEFVSLVNNGNRHIVFNNPSKEVGYLKQSVIVFK